MLQQIQKLPSQQDPHLPAGVSERIISDHADAPAVEVAELTEREIFKAADEFNDKHLLDILIDLPHTGNYTRGEAAELGETILRRWQETLSGMYGDRIK